MDVEQDDTLFLRLSPLLALLAAWGTWMLIAMLEEEEGKGAPPLAGARVEVPGADDDCGGTWVVTLPTARCQGPYVANPAGGEERREPYTATLTPMGGPNANARGGGSCTLLCFGGEFPRAELIVSVDAGGFRGRVRCDPAVGDPIDLYVGPVYTEAGESVKFYAWRLDSDALGLFTRLTDTCPYLRPDGPGEVPAKHGIW